MIRLLILLPSLCVSFIPTSLITTRRHHHGALQMAGGIGKVAVIGPREGVSGAIAKRLQQEGNSDIIALSDSAGLAGTSANVVIVSGDPGQKGGPTLDDLSRSAISSLPSTTEYVVYVNHPEVESTVADVEEDEEESSGFSFKLPTLPNPFAGAVMSPLDLVRDVKGPKVIVVHTSRLFGPPGGPDPVPFSTGPKAEPALDECWTKGAALLGGGTLLAKTRDSGTKRSTVAEVVARLLVEGGGTARRKKGIEFSVVSVVGEPTTGSEWEEELAKLDDDDAGFTVLSIDFAAMPGRAELGSWMANSWGPAMLRRVESNMIRSGPRPVRVAVLSGGSAASTYAPDGGAEVLWEAPTRDLEAELVGRLRILLRDTQGSAGLRVVRCDGSGQPLGTPLVGEDEIVQNLLEALNNVAYAKGYVLRREEAVREVSVKPVPAKVPVRTAVMAESGGAQTQTQTVTEVKPPPGPKGRGRRSGRKS